MAVANTQRARLLPELNFTVSRRMSLARKGNGQRDYFFSDFPGASYCRVTIFLCGEGDVLSYPLLIPIESSSHGPPSPP